MLYGFCITLLVGLGGYLQKSSRRSQISYCAIVGLELAAAVGSSLNTNHTKGKAIKISAQNFELLKSK